MTRTYIAKRLLEHGPLTAAQFREITGWKDRTPESALSNLMKTGLVRTVRQKCGLSKKPLYALVGNE